MRLTNYITFAQKKTIPPEGETPHFFAHAYRGNLKEFRTAYKKIERKQKGQDEALTTTKTE
jgi:hypothetical protein